MAATATRPEATREELERKRDKLLLRKVGLVEFIEDSPARIAQLRELYVRSESPAAERKLFNARKAATDAEDEIVEIDANVATVETLLADILAKEPEAHAAEVQAVGRDRNLLTDDEASRLREQARRTVLRRLDADGTALVGDSDGDGAVRAVQVKHDLDVEMRGVRAEFATGSHDVDPRSALCHLKATAVLAASQKPATYENYVAALAAVADDAGRRDVSDDVIAERCEVAAALSDLAEYNLRTRGVRRSDPSFEEQYIAEICAVSSAYGLPYYDGRA
jgi:hypothetical protein